MGRKRVTLAIDADALRAAMAGKETFSERAEKYGVSRQAVNGWLEAARIPPRALAELARDLDLAPDVVDAILAPAQDGKDPKRKRRRFTVTLHVDEHLYDDVKE
jgi:hypothetical protein